MREILFRGKRLDDGQWVYGYYVGPVGIMDDHEICDVNDITGCRYDVDHTTAGQYTGLTDKNGVKIFEGDIVKDDSIYMTGTVIYANGRYAINEVNDGLQEWEYWSDCEVVGNIHDNPEILEGGGS